LKSGEPICRIPLFVVESALQQFQTVVKSGRWFSCLHQTQSKRVAKRSGFSHFVPVVKRNEWSGCWFSCLHQTQSKQVAGKKVLVFAPKSHTRFKAKCQPESIQRFWLFS